MGAYTESAQRAISNTARRRRWTKNHPGDVIRCHVPDGERPGEWWECLRDGKQIAEANTQDMLLDQLDRAFR